MKATTPSDPSIVSLAKIIVKIQAERKTAQTRFNAISAEMSKLGQTLVNCDKTQAAAQREMDRLSAQQ